MAPNDTTSRRRVLQLSGAAVAAAVGAGTASADHTHADVETEPATDIDSNSATLNGDLIDMGNADPVDVWFDWGEFGTGLPNSTSRRTRSSPGSFSAILGHGDDLEPETVYEFQAVSDTGSVITTGTVGEFATDPGFDLP